MFKEDAIVEIMQGLADAMSKAVYEHPDLDVGSVLYAVAFFQTALAQTFIAREKITTVQAMLVTFEAAKTATAQGPIKPPDGHLDLMPNMPPGDA